MPGKQIDFATGADLGALTAIYNHYVVNSTVTFDITPWSIEARTGWFSQFASNNIHQCLVTRVNGQVVGYATSAPLRPKPAYRRSVETSIYIAPGFTGQGLGKPLYQQLLTNLRNTDVHRCYGVIALPNLPSIKLHELLGYKTIAHHSEVGWKFNRYWDTAWMEARL